ELRYSRRGHAADGQHRGCPSGRPVWRRVDSGRALRRDDAGRCAARENALCRRWNAAARDDSQFLESQDAWLLVLQVLLRRVLPLLRGRYPQGRERERQGPSRRYRTAGQRARFKVEGQEASLLAPAAIRRWPTRSSARDLGVTSQWVDWTTWRAWRVANIGDR